MGSVEGLRMNESDHMRFVFSVYQCEKDKIDSTELGSLFRACNLNPSLDRLEKLGMGKKQGEKILTLDECFKLLVELKKETKDQGCYEDFIELCKLYDKNEDGKMLLAELSHSLAALGERLTDDQIEELFEDCLGEEDDDGFIEYDPFLAAMCEVKKEAPAPVAPPPKKK